MNLILKKKNKILKKNKYQIKFEYKHPGTFREFEYQEKVNAPDEDDSSINNEDNKINTIKKKFWSCCMNSDENSKGCQKIAVKNFKWIYDP